ncbi:MAG: hypothetical protein IPL32_09160 [Chloracidobacterium sp.]|nr:hypothetical protein [Chloracidobacterium sp.]
MTAKITAFLITMIAGLATGVVIFFSMLLAMNGYSESDAMWGLGAYILMALMVVILSSTGAYFLVGSLTKKQLSPVVCVLIAVVVFSLLGIGLEIVCSLVGVGVAEFVRVKF